MHPNPPFCTNLSDIIGWSHHLCTEVLRPGDMAVDLTAGNGNDCLHLANCVAPQTSGTLVAFDIQRHAIEASSALLSAHGFHVCIHTAAADDYPLAPPDPSGQESTGIHLVHASHEHLCRYMLRPPKVILANLGYLPGGDHSITTTAPCTMSAVQQGLTALLPKGRLIVVIYPGHANGHKEATELQEFFPQLPKKHWDVIQMGCPNADRAPFVVCAEKRR